MARCARPSRDKECSKPFGNIIYFVKREYNSIPDARTNRVQTKVERNSFVISYNGKMDCRVDILRPEALKTADIVQMNFGHGSIIAIFGRIRTWEE